MISKTALVLFSHGSLLCGSEQTLTNHAERVRAAGNYLAVEPGYLNYSMPPVEDAIQRCAEAGATTVVIAPYFLVAGKFVSEDLPRRLEPITLQYPWIRFVMARALEDSDVMQLAVEQVALTAREPAQWLRDAVGKALGQCELRSDCPLYNSVMCRAGGAPVGEAVVEFESARANAAVTALMLILHGSPRPEANQPARELAASIQRAGRFSKVGIAYLECNSPSIPEALDDCAHTGVSEIIAVPYFLHAGRHLVLDVPDLLLEGTRRHPQMQIRISDAVGTSPLISRALARRANEAMLK